MSKFGRLFPLLCLFWSQTDPNPPLFYKFLTKIVILFILCSYLPIIMKMHHASDCFSFFTLMLRQSPQAAVVPPQKKDIWPIPSQVSFFCVARTDSHNTKPILICSLSHNSYFFSSPRYSAIPSASATPRRCNASSESKNFLSTLLSK